MRAVDWLHQFRWKRWPFWLLPAILALSIAIFLRATGRMEFAGYWAADWFGMYSQPALRMEDVVIVGLDDRDVAELKVFPITDGQLNAVLAGVLAADPLLVGLGFLRHAAMPPGHEALMATMRNDSRIVGLDSTEPDSSNLNYGLDFLEQQGRSGSMVSVRNSDGYQRMTLMGFVHPTAKSFTVGLPIAFAKHYVARTQPQVQQGGLQELRTAHGTLQSTDQPFGEQRSGESGTYLFLLPAAQIDAVPIIPFRDVTAGRVPRERFESKVVFVTNVAPTMQDELYVPGRRHVFGATRPVPSSVAFAVSTQQLIDFAQGTRRGALRAPPAWLDWLLIVCVVAASVAFSLRYRHRQRWWQLGIVLGAPPVLAYGLFLLSWWISWVSASLAQLIYFSILAYRNWLTSRSLRDAASLVSALMDNVPDPMLVVDQHSQIRIVNEAMCSCLGVLPRDLIGKPKQTFLQDDADAAAPSEVSLQATDVFGDSWHFIASIVRIHDSQGRSFDAYIVKFAHRDAHYATLGRDLDRRFHNARYWARKLRQHLAVISVRSDTPADQVLLNFIQAKLVEALPRIQAMWIEADAVQLLVRYEHSVNKAKAAAAPSTDEDVQAETRMLVAAIEQAFSLPMEISGAPVNIALSVRVRAFQE
jgi:PAS domain S-box-containing protein